MHHASFMGEDESATRTDGVGAMTTESINPQRGASRITPDAGAAEILQIGKSHFTARYPTGAAAYSSLAFVCSATR